MPIYEYFCKKCNKSFDILQKLNTKEAVCAICNRKTKHKLISSGNFELLGEGFYKQNYRFED